MVGILWYSESEWEKRKNKSWPSPTLDLLDRTSLLVWAHPKGLKYLSKRLVNRITVMEVVRAYVGHWSSGRTYLHALLKCFVYFLIVPERLMFYDGKQRSLSGSQFWHVEGTHACGPGSHEITPMMFYLPTPSIYKVLFRKWLVASNVECQDKPIPLYLGVLKLLRALTIAEILS